MEDITEEAVVEDEQQEQVETVEKAQYDAILAELEDVKGKLPQELTEAERAIQDKQKELWNKEVNLELKEAGLHDFAEFFFVEENNSEQLQLQIQKFQEVLGKRELNDGFVPEGHRSADKYSLAEKSKDTKTMIGTKLSALFNK